MTDQPLAALPPQKNIRGYPLFWITGKVHMWLAFVALAIAFGWSFDVLVTLMVLHQVPAGTKIRNNGWDTYWKPTENPQ